MDTIDQVERNNFPLEPQDHCLISALQGERSNAESENDNNNNNNNNSSYNNKNNNSHS